MKLCFFFLLLKRHCSSLISSNPQKTQKASPKQSQILHLCKLGSLLDAIGVLNSIDPTEITLKPLLYASLLQTCTKSVSLNHGLQIHAHVIKSGLETDRFVGNSLLSLYFKLIPNMSETRKVFDGLFFKDVISWTSMIDPKPQKWHKRWKFWGLTQRKNQPKHGIEQESWKKLRRVANGEANASVSQKLIRSYSVSCRNSCKMVGLLSNVSSVESKGSSLKALQRNRSARYSPSNLDRS